MSHTSFGLARFQNRNGSTSWRVSGFLSGVRIRKNFLTREEAALEKASLERRVDQLSAGLRVVGTTLSDDLLREAEVNFAKLQMRPGALTSYVDFALAHYRAPVACKQIAEAVSEYTQARRREVDQGHLSSCQVERIGYELGHLCRNFPSLRLDALTVPTLIAFLERGHPSLKTYNNRRGIVSTFLRFAFQRGWIAENPTPRISHHRIRRRRGTAKTLTAARAKEIMSFLETYEKGIWVPFFALALFAGIRPSVPDGEISKLKPEDIDLSANLITVSAEISKVREMRKVQIQPNLAAWLRFYPLDRCPIVVADHFRKRATLGKRLGLSHDVLRHTFISMFVAKFRSLGEAALQCGNSESVIRNHYLELKTKEEAEEFFSIVPTRDMP